MGFFAKTVCPECSLVTERHYRGNGFSPNHILTHCKCGYVYDNRAAVVEMTKDGDVTKMSPEWARHYADIPDVDATVKTKCPMCGLVKKHDVKLGNLHEIKELTECRCGYIYHNKSNMVVEAVKIASKAAKN